MIYLFRCLPHIDEGKVNDSLKLVLNLHILVVFKSIRKCKVA